MRVAALYDVHGNLPALEAVLDEVDAHAIVVGGDVASGPFPRETLERLQGYGSRVHFLRGNADRVLDFDGANDGEPWVRSRYWVAERLGEEHLAFLAGLPLDITLDVGGLGPVRFCHGAPGSDEQVITRVTSDERLRGLLAGIEESMVVCGHTHIQFDASSTGSVSSTPEASGRPMRGAAARTGSRSARTSRSAGRSTTWRRQSRRSPRAATRTQSGRSATSSTRIQQRLTG